MQQRPIKISTSVLMATTLGGIIWASAGDLNPPPGPVTSTMKTLTEVEPRIPIGLNTTPGDNDSVYKISTIGSFYLTGNVFGAAGKAGIEIAASNVTIDLNGFVVSGLTFPPGQTLDGIRVTQVLTLAMAYGFPVAVSLLETYVTQTASIAMVQVSIRLAIITASRVTTSPTTIVGSMWKVPEISSSVIPLLETQ